MISVIIPCFNEEDVLPIFYKEICKIVENLKEYRFEFIFINDGSKDATLDIIKNLSNQDERVKYISFSRNFGKEAGIMLDLNIRQVIMW